MRYSSRYLFYRVSFIWRSIRTSSIFPADVVPFLRFFFKYQYNFLIYPVFQGELSFQYKVMSMLGAYLSVLFALYFYYRHNTHCEPGSKRFIDFWGLLILKFIIILSEFTVYTMFALSEYTFVVVNIFYHSTLLMDFPDKVLTLVGSHNLDTFLPTDEEPLVRRSD